LVDDKEYKYTIGSGFAFYPRNYDLTYHGRVNLHYALTNSLNVPTVKVLEFVGLDNFYDFMQKDLGFKPLRPMSDYELGIALGGLDMDLVTLTDYFSIFPNSGRLKALRACPSGTCGLSGMADFSRAATVGDPRYVALVNKIISDRLTGADQFGAKSDLNLPYKNYAVKTGTSRDFHDSWTVGFTPDFVVGAWAGNSTDEPMDNVSGQTGAGRIWHEAMQMMYNSDYSRQSNFDFSAIKEYSSGNDIVYGLPGDNFAAAENLLLEDNLIISPHDGDTYLLAKNLDIILQAKTKADWRVNGELVGSGEKIIFRPKNKGTFAIEATSGEKTENLKIIVSDNK
jgi:membrane carboxypeptidase/penicillin-binding protein PbpC